MRAIMSRSSSSFCAACFSASSPCARSSLVSAIRTPAPASCFSFLRRAISSEARLRFAFRVSATVIRRRRSVSSTRKSFNTSAGSIPRWRSFSSIRGRLSRTNPRSSIRDLIYRKGAFLGITTRARRNRRFISPRRRGDAEIGSGSSSPCISVSPCPRVVSSATAWHSRCVR